MPASESSAKTRRTMNYLHRLKSRAVLVPVAVAITLAGAGAGTASAHCGLPHLPPPPPPPAFKLPAAAAPAGIWPPARRTASAGLAADCVAAADAATSSRHSSAWRSPDHRWRTCRRFGWRGRTGSSRWRPSRWGVGNRRGTCRGSRRHRHNGRIGLLGDRQPKLLPVTHRSLP